ncbi:hypothetical protein QUC31_017567 [Theobroma cacao]
MTTSLPSPGPEVSLSLTLPPCPTPLEAVKPEERGIRLIQLLLTCAKHASSGNLHRADECLRQISLLASVSGDSIQRLSVRFASALAIRLVKRWPGLHKALNYTQLPKQEFDDAKPFWGRAFPYLGLSYAIITRTLIKATMGERVIHLVDVGSGDVNLWVPLLRSLSCMPDGPPHLKVSCMNANKAVVDKLGARLVKEAEALDMAFQFNPLNVSLKELTSDMLKVRSGEALAFISILNLHALLAEDDRVDAHFGDNRNINGIKNSKQMCHFLTMMRSLSPNLLLVVEQEADHNLNRLVDRFVEGLHYYSAVFDAIDAAFGPTSSGERHALEGMFGKEIENIVACEGVEREERHERHGRWMVRFGQAGFKPVRIWYDSMEDANQMVEACGKDGYKIVQGKAGLMICWHDRPLYAVSAWTC